MQMPQTNDPRTLSVTVGYGRIVTYDITLTQEGLLSNTGRSRKKLSCGLRDRSRRSERGKLVSFFSFDDEKAISLRLDQP
jgi:hypothetical protein